MLTPPVYLHPFSITYKYVSKIRKKKNIHWGRRTMPYPKRKDKGKSIRQIYDKVSLAYPPQTHP
jgi:hypothetical protein